MAKPSKISDRWEVLDADGNVIQSGDFQAGSEEGLVAYVGEDRPQIPDGGTYVIYTRREFPWSGDTGFGDQ